MRSTSRNGPTILAGFATHRKALQGVLHTGIAKGHRANPSKNINIDKMYAIPVLMSGLAPLVLSDQEIVMIDQHHKKTQLCVVIGQTGVENDSSQKDAWISLKIFLISLPHLGEFPIGSYLKVKDSTKSSGRFLYLLEEIFYIILKLMYKALF